jgi:hypothetical protein
MLLLFHLLRYIRYVMCYLSPYAELLGNHIAGPDRPFLDILNIVFLLHVFSAEHQVK